MSELIFFSFFLHRITGEPLFGNSSEGFMYTDEQLDYGSSNEHSPSVLQASAIGGFDFRSHPTDLENFLSAAVGHQQILHGAVDFQPDESDDDNETSEESDDIQSDGDESSTGELDE